MTDLKHLLDEAAGDEPAITDQDLTGDLRRGKRSARRRSVTGVVAGVAATALVITGGWALLPDGKQSGTSIDPGVAGSPSKSPSIYRPSNAPGGGPGTGRTYVPPDSEYPPVPPPATPVELVADPEVRPGTDLDCDLRPKGWEVKVIRAQNGNQSLLTMSDPKLDWKGKYNEATTYLSVRHAKIADDGTGRMLVEKYDKTWDELRAYQHRAGSRMAVVAGGYGPVPAKDGVRDIHMRMSDTKLIQVSNSASGLGWDLATVLRFTGSCHYK